MEEVFWHKRLKLILVVYVDDFKLAGPKGSLAEGWSLISSEIAMGQPGPVGRFLGCNHVPAESLVTNDTFNPREAWSREDPAKKDPPKLDFLVSVF